MNDPSDLRGIAAHELASLIREARERGNKAEADRLVQLFNQRLSGKADVSNPAPQPPQTHISTQVPPPINIPFYPPEVQPPVASAEPKTAPPTVPPVAPEVEDNPLADLQKSSRSFDSYPENIRPLLEDILNEFSKELKIPKAVLTPSLLREFDQLFRERQRQEPLLLRLPRHIQMRSVLVRYQDILKERLQ